LPNLLFNIASLANQIQPFTQL